MTGWGTEVAVFAIAACVPAALVYWARKDVLDPRITFALPYFYLTSAPLLWFAAEGRLAFGIVGPLVSPVVLSCASAVLSFHVGCTLSTILVRPQAPEIPCRRAESQARVDRRVRHLALMASLVLLLAHTVVAYSLKARIGEGDKPLILSGDPLLKRLYGLTAAAVVAALIVLVVADARIGRGRVSRGVLAALSAHAFICFWGGERDVLLVVAALMLCNVRHWSRNRTLAVLTLALLFMAVVPLARRGGLSASFDIHQQLGEAYRATPDDIVASLKTTPATNLHVFTNVASWIPQIEAHRYGATYLQTLISFLPIRGKLDLGMWFKNKYAPGGTSGYGFAMDAEAYLNFGWAGPAIVFCAWGAALGALHQRARRQCNTGMDQFLWTLALPVSLFCIRADSRTLVKYMVYGGMGAWALWSFAALAVRRSAVGTACVRR